MKQDGCTDATATFSTAAITGFLIKLTVVNIPETPSIICWQTSSLATKSAKSLPAVNLPPAPVNTITLSSSEASASLNARLDFDRSYTNSV
jgi:hypothetical protein